MISWTSHCGFSLRASLKFWAVGVFLIGTTIIPAADPPTEPKAASPTESVAAKQEAVSLRYQRFENTLRQLAEYLRKTDPDRAELLVRALGRSSETRLPDQFAEVIQLLQRDQLGDAISSQETVVQQLQTLLVLLQSEDRQSEIEKEKARLRALVQDVDKLISRQTDVRAATERGTAPGDVEKQQQKVTDQTQKIVDKINEQDAEKARAQRKSTGKSEESGDASRSPSDDSSKPSPSDSPSDRGKTDDGGKPKTEGPQPNPEKTPPEPKSPNEKPSDPKGPDQKPDGQQSPNDSSKPEDSPDKNSPPGKNSPPSKNSPSGQPPSSPKSPQKSQPQSGEPSDDAPMPGGDQDNQPQPPQEDSEEKTPGRQELQQARKEMERAIEELRKKQLDKASDQQDRALADLLKAKEKLEAILRQLREEEKELVLTALEARFRDMLGRQIAVFNGTVGLAAVPEEQRTDRQRGRSIELARQQDEVGLLAAKALTLLKEEGSSIAFPEAVGQIRDDMISSARRLERVDVGEVTQAIQRDIVESLEEILDSLQKEIEKSKDRQQQQQQQQQQPQEQGLVDGLAELKMIRSLQYRINRRTKQLGRLVDGEQARDQDVVRELQALSAKQAKIQQTAYDLATGRNK